MDNQFIYSINTAFNSGTVEDKDMTDASWSSTYVPLQKTIEDEMKDLNKSMKKAGKAYTDLDATFKSMGKESGKLRFCNTCGNPYEKKDGLDDNFCSAECKYKYCEIEEDADKNSE